MSPHFASRPVDTLSVGLGLGPGALHPGLVKSGDCVATKAPAFSILSVDGVRRVNLGESGAWPLQEACR